MMKAMNLWSMLFLAVALSKSPGEDIDTNKLMYNSFRTHTVLLCCVFYNIIARSGSVGTILPCPGNHGSICILLRVMSSSVHFKRYSTFAVNKIAKKFYST
jgi:hypothetical protein